MAWCGVSLKRIRHAEQRSAGRGRQSTAETEKRSVLAKRAAQTLLSWVRGREEEED